ncbi:MAG TPA: choice-of-anchor D domain-containing protein, partial [Myxococcales bacterium]|nr:choice-of-anchor D domain-containing protein [Myxococcales bacterium]
MLRRLIPWGLAGAIAIAAAGCDRDRAANADGHLLVFPGTLDFARVAMYGDHAMDVDLQNAGRTPVIVEEISLEGAADAYSAEMQARQPERLEPDAHSGVKVHFVPLSPGDQQAALVIRTDSLRDREVRIPLSGVGVDAHALLSTDTLDYGRIEAQAKKTLTLTFQNTADIPIDVGTRFAGADADEFSTG